MSHSKTFTPPRRILIILAVILLIASCKKDVKNDVTKKNPKKQFDTAPYFFICQSVATSYYARMAYQKYANGEPASNDTSSVPCIKNTIIVHDTTSAISMYIFNFGTNQGFVVMSSDLRVAPVFAFSNSGSILGSYSGTVDGLPTDSLAANVNFWFKSEAAYIANVRSTFADSNTLNGYFALKWFQLLGSPSTSCINRNAIQSYPGSLTNPGMFCNIGPSGNIIIIGIPIPPSGGGGGSGGCDSNIVLKYFPGGMLSTKWDQGNTYNDDFSNATGCSSGTNMPSNGKWWAGCVMTATAQLMRWFNYPATPTYYWSSMPNNPPGNIYIQQLMVDIANNDILYGGSVNFSCGGTGASLSDIDYMLTQHWGYSSHGYELYNWSDVKNSIDASWPVIMDGDLPSTEGHAWIVDGYRLATACGYSNLYHMNWGWSGKCNGWYELGSFNPIYYPAGFNTNVGIINWLHH